MGTKYSSNSSSGYNATPPADDGTVSEANKVKYATVKTKLSDPIKDLADTINSELVTHFNNGPIAVTSNTTLGASHYNQIVQVSGSGVTLTLSDAATLGAGWYAKLINTDSSNTISLVQATVSDTLNGSTANGILNPKETLFIFVNAAANGFLTIGSGFIQGSNIPKIPTVSNLSLTATLGSNALTIAVKGSDGNDPSASNPVWIPFRNVTSATGTQSWLSITAATSLIISSGSTLGTISGVLSKLAVGLFNDGGTIRLAVSNISGMTLADDVIASSTAEGGAGAADSSAIWYSGTAVSSKALKIIGLIESTQTTAGTWAQAISKIQLGNSWLFEAIGMKKLASGTVSAAATLDIPLTSYTQYPNKLLKLRSFVPATDGVSLSLRISLDGGSTFKAGATDYDWVGTINSAGGSTGSASTASQISLTDTTSLQGNGAGRSLNSDIELKDTTNTAVFPQIEYRTTYVLNGTATVAKFDASGRYKTAASNFDAVRLLFSSGNITSGSWELYGYA